MNVRALACRYRFIVFSVITLGLAAAVFASGMSPAMVPFVLVVLPTVGALVTAAISGRGELGLLGRRITRWRVSPWLYAAAIGIPLVGTLLIVILAVATGTPTTDLFSDMSAAALVVPLVVLLPALLEEFGWRGFGIPTLGRLPLLASALIVAIPFTLIHIPLHLPGHLNDGLPMWPSILSLIAYSLVFGWMFSVSQGSALLAGFMHATANGAISLTWGIDPVRVWELRGIAFAIVAMVVVALAWRTFMAPARDVPASPDVSLAATPRHLTRGAQD